ncbi:hypothetical protein AYI69_g8775 [Smittium culicis]|uniref:Uncharacterized protein n=1 Tax=Smittium culicis TaxID=133412 RepID=A0A1R1XH70_9FUNG|nr:hypothetical protein AYI69_g8775 [Smittium culicis]
MNVLFFKTPARLRYSSCIFNGFFFLLVAGNVSLLVFTVVSLTSYLVSCNGFSKNDPPTVANINGTPIKINGYFFASLFKSTTFFPPKLFLVNIPIFSPLSPLILMHYRPNLVYQNKKKEIR